jgi:hypothetical protein
MTKRRYGRKPAGVRTRLRTRQGAMLFDAALTPVADERWFDPQR